MQILLSSKHILNNQGKDALLAVETVEKTALFGPVQNGKRHNVGGIALKAAVVALTIMLVVVSVLTGESYNEIRLLQTQATKQKATLADVQNQATEQKNTLDDVQNELYAHDTLITQLDTELQWDHAVSNMKAPSGDQYLTTLSENNQEVNLTKIYLNSTEYGYDYSPQYPFTTPWFNGTSGGSFSSLRAFELTGNRSICLSFWGLTKNLGPNYSGVEFRTGTPYLIIGAVLRNDYSFGSAAVGTSFMGNVTRITVSVKLVNQNGSLIPTKIASGISSSSLRGDYGIVIQSGETKATVFYLVPASLDIDHYELYVSSITAYNPYA